MVETTRPQNEYNGAELFQRRVDYLLRTIIESKESLNTERWLIAAGTLFSELYTEMNDKERKVLQQEREALFNEYYQSIVKKKNPMWSIYYSKLESFENKLRLIYDDCGAQNRKRRDILAPANW